MNLVTINNIWLKCYLKFYKIVPAEMGGLNRLAVALDSVKFVLGKIIKKFYCFFAIFIFISFSSTYTCQRILSLSERCNALTISTGIVVLNDFEWAVCKFAVDSNSNNFIPPFMLFFINIFDNILYIIYPHSDSSSVNIYHTFIYYKVDN